MYHRIDPGLDLLPYNGHTTSYDAFWMGVAPPSALVGKTVVGRAGWGLLLTTCGPQELAARSAGGVRRTGRQPGNRAWLPTPGTA